MKKRKKARQKAIALVAVVLLFFMGYALSANGGEKILNIWKGWNTNESTPEESSPNDSEPQNENQFPEAEPNPPLSSPPAEGEGGDAPEYPVIYSGQQLLIPVAGQVKSELSQVISQGLLFGENKQIALTFDAGWLSDQTIPLLDTLDRYGLKSTFFTRALWVQSHPILAKEIVKRGHIIENHSLTHGHMKEMTVDQIRNELKESTRIIKEVTSGNPYLFRPPYGEYDNRILKVLAEEGYPYTVMWTVDSHDWAEEIRGEKVTVDYLVKRVLNNASDNGIILMHIGGYNTVQALPRIITGLREQGYRFVTVNDMMPPPQHEVLVHIVKQGDTLFSLSRKYGVTMEQIIHANGLN